MAIRRIAAVAVMATLLAAGGAALWYSKGRGDGDSPSARTARAQPPLAAWMRAAPDPLVLGPPAMSNSSRQSEVSTGGELVELVANRQKFTLYVPRGAVALDARIRMTAISALPGLPFADPAIAAVRVDNLPSTLRKPVTLTIEPASLAAGDAPINASAIAMHSASREMHLYPFTHSGETVRKRRQSRYQLLVDRDGVYAIANATAGELEAAYARTPTDHLSRLEMMVARALHAPRPMPTASLWSRWSPVSTAHAQSADDRKQLDAFVLDAASALRDYHAQRLMPRLDELGRGCSDDDRDFFMTFTDESGRWLKSAQLIGFVNIRDEPELDTTTNPYAYHAEAERRTYFTQLEKEFGAKAVALQQGLLAGTRRMFDAVRTCCRKQPARWMPAYMVGMQRGAELGGYASTLSADGLADVQACGCSVDAVLEGKGWTGSIKQTDTSSGEAGTITSRSQATTTSSHRYHVHVALVAGDGQGSARGLATASGERAVTTRRVDTDWACAVDEAGISTQLGGGSGTTLDDVSISLRDDGSYLINYPLPQAGGLEVQRNYSRRAGCKNRFNDRSTDRTTVRATAVASRYHKPIRGQTDNATVLTGSMTVQLPDTGLERNRQATVEWNVRACAVN
jgi:hypothetical protein